MNAISPMPTQELLAPKASSALAVKAGEALMTKAEECSALAADEHELADKQHAHAERLSVVSHSLEQSAVNLTLAAALESPSQVQHCGR